MPSSSVTIRRAASEDLPALGRLGAQLMRVHYEFDASRFMTPGEDPARGYAWFLGSQLARRDVAIFVADGGGAVVGYLYAGIEGRSWKELRDRAGFIHDLLVEEGGRRAGVATALIAAAVEWFRSRRVPRVVLWTAEQNAAAQQLFARVGFRRTMVEMTLEL